MTSSPSRVAAIAGITTFSMVAAAFSALGAAQAAPAAATGTKKSAAVQTHDDVRTDANTNDDLQELRDAIKDSGVRIVTLADAPAATYTGGIDGLTRTQPEQGKKLNAAAPEVKAYEDHLRSKHAEVAKAHGITIDTQLTLTSNSFVAQLTDDQISKLEADNRVLGLHVPGVNQVNTINSPKTLGLDGPRGMWRQFGTPRRAGNGVVVGILDSGYTPESPSFSGAPLPQGESKAVNRPAIDADGNITMKKSDGTTFKGSCSPERVEETLWTGKECNSKVIGAKSSTVLLGLYARLFGVTLPDGESKSPRDRGGHGTHVASTAVGNYAVPATFNGEQLGRISGMAPGAKLSVYKTCFDIILKGKARDGVCFGVDAALLVDQAVRDGVDVLNYSVSGNDHTSEDFVSQQFRNAAAAGIFVAAAAGNSGPSQHTANHTAPWVTTVGAATHHSWLAKGTLGNGEVYGGAAIMQREITGELITSEAAAQAGKEEAAILCDADSLDPAKVAGKIVVCKRGEIALVAKAVEVARAGGIGMVLINVDRRGTSARGYQVPTLHLEVEDGAKVWEYAKTEGATITLSKGAVPGAKPVPTPQIASFSSRGPMFAHGGDIMKPDIAAPGVDVWAAVAPAGNNGKTFTSMSGTSMASPHIAGLAALVFGKHPTFSPMQIKSAMMTTAFNTKNPDGSESTDKFSQGAGHVDPRKFLKPGLVFDSGAKDWANLRVGSALSKKDRKPEMEASNVNLASIAVNMVDGSETVTRTATAVSAGTYRAQVSGVEGFDVKVSPEVLTFAKPGEQKSFTVTFTRTTAPAGQATMGDLTWTGGPNPVRMPVVARPLAAAAVQEAVITPDTESTTATARLAAATELPVALYRSAASLRPTTGTLVKGDSFNPLGKKNESMTCVKFRVGDDTVLSRVEVEAGEGMKDVRVAITGNVGLLDFVPYIAGGDRASDGMHPGTKQVLNLTGLAPGGYCINIFAADADEAGGKFTANVYNVSKNDPIMLSTETTKVTGASGDTVSVDVSTKDTVRNRKRVGALVFGEGDDMTVTAIVQEAKPAE